MYYAKATTFNDPFDAQVNIEVNSTHAEAIDRHWLILRERARGRGGFVDTVQSTYTHAKFNVDRIYDKVQNGTHIDHDRYYRDMIDSLGIVSLAENRDNLLLWAHYASNHYGMCLGFEWDETGLPLLQRSSIKIAIARSNTIHTLKLNSPRFPFCRNRQIGHMSASGVRWLSPKWSTPAALRLMNTTKRTKGTEVESRSFTLLLRRKPQRKVHILGE
ncbi:hypothetical protein CES87_21875 [Pseudomonas sp. ERMR1:02]|nr:hypothetical protein CES87_21875 [Pseudomonas sp. ERMR1:02]